MAQYHFTDQLGQAVEEARAGAEKAAGAFSLLEYELKTERESHRVETLRLVERAEAAEGQLATLKTAVETLMTRLAPWELPAGIGPYLSEVIRLARS